MEAPSLAGIHEWSCWGLDAAAVAEPRSRGGRCRWPFQPNHLLQLASSGPRRPHTKTKVRQPQTSDLQQGLAEWGSRSDQAGPAAKLLAAILHRLSGHRLGRDSWQGLKNDKKKKKKHHQEVPSRQPGLRYQATASRFLRNPCQKGPLVGREAKSRKILATHGFAQGWPNRDHGCQI